jgi:glycosyl transferase family 87
VVVGSVAVAAWLPSGSKAWVSIGVAAAALLALAATAWTWGRVNIDVYDAVSGAANDVMHGRNPYLATVSFYYEPTPLHGAQTPAHFPYGPDVAVLAVPGQALGDVRVMSVLAIAATLAGLWWLARQGLHRGSAHRIVALGLASPLCVGMVLFAWVDVYMMAFLVGWLALRRSHRRWSIVLLAAAMLVKPLALVVLVPWLVWSNRARLEILIAAVGALIFALPFALGVGLQAFAYDIVGVQLDLPPRFGALTLVAFAWKLTHRTLPSLVSILGVAALVAAIAWRGRPSDEADLSVQATVLSIASFLLAKWALFNYYFISEVMILVAMAAAGVRLAPGEVRLPFASFAQRMRSALSPSPRVQQDFIPPGD